MFRCLHFDEDGNGTRPIVSSAKWDASPLPRRPVMWDTSHMITPEIIESIRRRMLALGLNKKRLSLDSGNGETYVRDLLTGRSKNPKTEELQKVLDALDRAEAAAISLKKGRA